VANPPVAANVVDLRYDTPGRQDVFLVDSNVWYWTTYSLATLANRQPETYQTSDYPDYIKRCLDAGARLTRTPTALAEVASRIAHTEYEAYCRHHPFVIQKAYRSIRAERRNVVRQILTSCRQIQDSSECISAPADEQLERESLVALAFASLDLADAMMLVTARHQNIRQVITDDGDFATVSGVTIFTANGRVIREARRAGRLRTR